MLPGKPQASVRRSRCTSASSSRQPRSCFTACWCIFSRKSILAEPSPSLRPSPFPPGHWAPNASANAVAPGDLPFEGATCGCEFGAKWMQDRRPAAKSTRAQADMSSLYSYNPVNLDDFRPIFPQHVDLSCHSPALELGLSSAETGRPSPPVSLAGQLRQHLLKPGLRPKISQNLHQNSPKAVKNAMKLT